MITRAQIANWKGTRFFIRIAALALVLALPACAAGKRDVLWEIVSTCMDSSMADYCTTCVAPRVEAGCGRPCRESTEVWAESSQFVVLRDRKMCGCQDGFVHGLAIPKSRVTGVEDRSRPDGIWEFAWNVARQRLPETEIALAVNPQGQRTQDQLHVHLVRSDRGRLPTDPQRTARIEGLDAVWQTAAARAAVLGWQDYGLLVVKDAGAGYLLVIDSDNTEHKYTRYRCP
jgi:CDP-diacylglycerol pyrophosphatase